jgi:hypothetical protein
VSYVAPRLTLISQSLSLVRAGFRDREYSPMRFGDREPHAILEAPGTEMSARRDIASPPNYLWVVGKDSMGPTLISPNSSLKHKFVNLEEKAVVLGAGMRRLSSVRCCQNDVANTD